jgi:tetratricopeptide (TPR) repeat protein
VAFLLAFGLAVLGCAKAEPTDDALSPVASALEALGRAHRLADAAKTDAERQSALQALDEGVRALPKESAGPSAVWVVQDALARSAELELALGHADRAISRAEQGLRLGTESSVPVASLHTLKGRALEARGEIEQAVAAYHAALVVNQQLMERALAPGASTQSP